MKKLTRKTDRFKGCTLGLDLHQSFIQYAVLDAKGDDAGGGRIAADRKSLTTLLEQWKKKGAVQVAFEACGCFVWVFDLAVKLLGRECVHAAQAARIRMIANSQEKNDANDAWWLAYLLYERRLPEAYVAEGPLRELRIAGRELRSYTDLRSDLVRRARSHLAQEGIKLPKGWHTSALKLEATKKVLEAIKGVRGEALLALYAQVVQLGKEIATWRQKVETLSVAFPAIATLSREMPGLKTLTASLLYAELGDPTRFARAKSYAKATGLTPGFRESGGKRQDGGITRQGSRLSRWALTRAVIACGRCKKGAGAQVKAWVDKQVVRQKKKKKVIVAAARKLAEGVWRLLKWGETFDLKRAFPA